MHCQQYNTSNQTCSGKKQAAFFQPKLAINQPNDKYEQEADAMAEKVMKSSNSAPLANNFFQPSVLPVQRMCSECEEEEKQVHRKENNNTSPSYDASVEAYVGGLGSGGRSLSPAERNFFEPSFKVDFSSVRIHTDSRANDSARSINAHAYTQGNNIVFANNQYDPGSVDGKKLLAHELTHVIQQSRNISTGIQRQPDDEKKEPSSDIGKALKKNGLFQKLPDFAQEKILDEVDKAGETITKAILDKIIDFAPIDNQYKEGLKKAGEAIIKTFTGQKPASTSKCDAVPGYRESTSRDFKGQCCSGTTDSAQACCPLDRFATNESFVCCPPGELADSGGKCMKPGTVDISTICFTPGKKDSLGKCCYPPLQVIDGICSQPPAPEPAPPPINLSFVAGIIDDYNIDESVINPRQQSHFNKVKKELTDFIQICPASIISIDGFTDKPGTEGHNMGLGQRRADHMKFLLQLELLKVKVQVLPPLIFTDSKGESNPADVGAGEKFSAANRRVEIRLNAVCPPLGSPTFKLSTDTPLRLRL